MWRETRGVQMSALSFALTNTFWKIHVLHTLTLCFHYIWTYTTYIGRILPREKKSHVWRVKSKENCWYDKECGGMLGSFRELHVLRIEIQHWNQLATRIKKKLYPDSLHSQWIILFNKTFLLFMDMEIDISSFAPTVGVFVL